MEAEAILSARKEKDSSLEYEFKDYIGTCLNYHPFASYYSKSCVYEGTAHGFAARPNLKRPEIKKAHEEAFEQAVIWFQKTLVHSD